MKLLKRICFRLYREFFSLFKKLLPLSDIIIFESEGDFCDNARALYEYMVDNGYNEKYKLVWIVGSPDKYKKHLASNVKFISRKITGFSEAFSFHYYTGSAKFFFFTHPHWLKSWKKSQTVVNLGHAAWVKKAKGKAYEGKLSDFVINSLKIQKETLAEYLNCDKDRVISLGYPRNDMLFSKKKVNLSLLLNHKAFDKLILWMPTYRQCDNPVLSEDFLNNETGLPLITTNSELTKINELLKDKNLILALKLHHLQSTRVITELRLNNVVLLSDEDLMAQDIQLYEFVKCSDALITDYSSIAFDYLLLDRPIGYTLDDYEEYKKSRGFAFENPLDYMPGEHIYNFSELEKFIISVSNNTDSYKKDRSKLKEQIHIEGSESASKRILDYFDIKNKDVKIHENYAD